MFYEIRTYRLKTGTVPAYLKLVEQEGIAVQSEHLGRLVGYFSSEIGPLNEITHIWEYSSLDDRDRRRMALLRDERWLAFLPKIQALIETMETKILRPAAFSPLGGNLAGTEP